MDNTEKLEVSTEQPDTTVVQEDESSCTENKSDMSTGLLDVVSLENEKKATKEQVEEDLDEEKVCSSESTVTTEEFYVENKTSSQSTPNDKSKETSQNKSEEKSEHISEENQEDTSADSSGMEKKDRIDETSEVTSEDVKAKAECAETSKLGNLDEELDGVVTEATKLQSEVLKTIIGSKTKYIPKTIESIEDDQVAESDENSKDANKETINIQEGGTTILKTETIHIEMNIKDKIEEITIENEESEDTRELIGDGSQSRIPEALTSKNEKKDKSNNENNNCEVNLISRDTNQNIVESFNQGNESVDETGDNKFEKKDESTEKKGVIMVESETTEDDIPSEEQKVADVSENRNDTTNEIENLEKEHQKLEGYRNMEQKHEYDEDMIENNPIEADNKGNETLKQSAQESLQEEDSSMKSDTKEPSLSQTPDLVKVCEKEIDSSDEKNIEATDELQQIDGSINECQVKELNTVDDEISTKEKSSFQALDLQTSDSISKEMIVDLISGSCDNAIQTAGQKLKEGANLKQNIKENIQGKINEKETVAKTKKIKSEKQKVAKNATKKHSTIIAGQKVELNSDKAQYLHLTLEQIQELAMKQRSGELFGEEQSSVDGEVSHCVVHSTLKRKSSKKGSTASAAKQKLSTTQRPGQQTSENNGVKESNQSPDVIKEAEEAVSTVSRQFDTELGKDQNKEKLVDLQRAKRAKSPLKKNENIQVSKRSSSAGRSSEDSKQTESKMASTKVRERTFKKQDLLFDSNTNSESVKKKVSKSEMRKASVVKDAMSKGGLLAPTQSWLLHIGDKKEIKSRSPSPGPKEVKRSISVPRKLIDRSPSPKRRMQFITKDAEKNMKEHPTVQPSPKTQRRSLSVRASPDPNANLKRSGSIKRVQNIEKQDSISKSSSIKSTNGKRSTEQVRATINKDKKDKQTIKHQRKSQADDEEITEFKNSVSEQTTNTSITIDENENEKEINTMTATDESSSATYFQSETKTESLNQSSLQSSCIEETSITATEVIEMFESESKTESTETSVKLNDKVTKTKTNGLKTDVKKSGVQANAAKSETIQSSEKAKSSNKSSTSKLANGSSNQMTKTNGLSNAAVTSVKNSSVKNVTTNSESTKNKINTNTNRKTKSSELSELKTSEMATKISGKNSTKTKKSNCEESISGQGITKKETDVKPRTTMIIRLHPGNSKRVSAYLEHQGEGGSADNTLSWSEDVKYEDTPGAICGLEISFSSVPQDVDIKLISASDQGDHTGKGVLK